MKNPGTERRVAYSLLAWLAGSVVTALSLWIFLNQTAIATALKGNGWGNTGGWGIDNSWHFEIIILVVILLFSLGYGLAGWLAVLLPVSVFCSVDWVRKASYLTVQLLDR